MRHVGGTGDTRLFVTFDNQCGVNGVLISVRCAPGVSKYGLVAGFV